MTSRDFPSASYDAWKTRSPDDGRAEEEFEPELEETHRTREHDMHLSYNWTTTHRDARILRNHRAWLGFWFARDEEGSEFAISLFSRTFYVW